MDILKNNLKSKFLILTLCFTIIFSSLNINKSYADGGIISAPILATVVSAALGTGIVLKNKEEIYHMGKMFYDYVQNNNSIMWDTVVSAFESSVAFNSLTKQVTIGKEFGGILKGFFDDTFTSSLPSDIGETFVGSSLGFPLYDYRIIEDNKEWPLSTSIGVEIPSSYFDGQEHKFGDVVLQYSYPSLCITYNSRSYYISLLRECLSSPVYIFMAYNSDYNKFCFVLNTHFNSNDFRQIHHTSGWLTLSSVVSVPYNGTYNPGNVWGDTEEGIKDVPIYVPGNLGDILNGNPSDVVGDKAPGWVGNGDVSVPGVNNPSIGIGGSTSFPTTDTGVGNPSIPGTGTDTNTGIWATIKDFIISLVVPSDTFWTDTWNGLYSGFVSAFPGVDMDNFNSLVTGEKKFPNIDINIMGVKGRVVNGDVINSIVDWLRPIIAGFMMLCLMFFNYRKIYKLIRNSEPFGGISPGTSDFSTGISEYSYKSKEISKGVK